MERYLDRFLELKRQHPEALESVDFKSLSRLGKGLLALTSLNQLLSSHVVQVA